MDLTEFFDPQEIGGEVKEKLLVVLERLEELKALDELVYYKFLLILSKFKRNNVDSSTQWEEQEAEVKDWGNDIVGEVKAIAEQTVSDSGFVFDRTTGSYYNESQNCYYIPDYKLYYYQQTGAYYYYDEETKGLKFYSYVNKDDDRIKEPVINHEAIKANKRIKRTHQEKEDGECSEEEATIEKKPVLIEKEKIEQKPIVPETKQVAPSIRLIVQKSDIKNIAVGKLFLITKYGGTLGREGKHDVLIPDKSVSKLHSRFYYSNEKNESVYKIVDLGSRNGTFVDGVRLSESLNKSKPKSLHHGNLLTVGCTELVCHIHEGDKTCSDCETKPRNIKEQHLFEQNQIRQKFGLSKGQSDFRVDSKYKDRSERRRKTEGSSHDSEKTEVASVDLAINEKNKGFKLLEKMGWKEGTKLGKDDSKGLLEPILVQQRGKRGLGASEHVDLANLESKKGRTKGEIWSKTKKRYEESNYAEPD